MGASVLVVVLIPAMSLAACGGEDEGETIAPSAQVTTQAAATEVTTEDEAAEGLTVELSEENASGQTGTASIAPSGEGVAITVDVTDQGVGQHALISSGSCDNLEAPFAAIEGQETGITGVSNGKFEDEELVRFQDAAPVTLDELEASEFAVVVVDASFRGGAAEEIPAETRLLNVPDPEGPFGGGSYPLAACGDIRPR